jgi:ABC-type multidrug transport system ATPase subunit/ABC-type transport system involved in multi-copper enzyme maturation permease subunit
MIHFEHVSKRYGRRVALDDVTLALRPGEITLLLGANGAGKSTLLRCALGITSYEGSISVAGLDPLRQGCAVRSLVGYMPQTGGLHPDLTVDDTLRLYADIRGASAERAAELLAEAGLGDHQRVKVGDLSGGLRQRLGFALALLTDPPVLILDEPSASLDAVSRAWLAGRLRAMALQGRTVLVSTHAGQELLDIGDRVVVLEDGRLVETRDVDRPANPRGRTEAAAPHPRKPASVRPLIVKELRDAVGSRWLTGYAALLAALGVAAAWTGIDSSSGLALEAFGRTTATLMNLCLMLAPLVAVLMGAASIAGERERGTLEHLLAQPLSRSRLLLAKHAGLLVSLTAATVAGFIPAGVMIAREAGPGVLGHYLLFPAIAALAGAAMLAIGMVISVSSRSAAQSQGAAVFAWFAFVLLYDLVLMGSLATAGMPVQALSAALVANPVDAARVLGVLALEPDLYLLGPAGAYLTAQLSASGAAVALLVALLSWATLPLAAAIVTFTRPMRSKRRSDGGRARSAPAASSGRRPVRSTEVTFS